MKEPLGVWILHVIQEKKRVGRARKGGNVNKNPLLVKRLRAHFCHAYNGSHGDKSVYLFGRIKKL